MSIRDREVVDLLRDEPELLAIADAVAETQAPPRRLRPFRALFAVVVAAAVIFALVLASPWDRGGGRGTVLERALAAIDTQGPVLHLTTRLDMTHANQKFPAFVSESYYDKSRHLAHVVTRIEGKVVSDYTTSAVEDEFATFPGLLDQADFYSQALASGRAKIVGKGEWQGRSVYWVELEKGGGFIFRVGIDRESYRPVVFRGVNPDGTPAGFQLAVLGYDYVSTKEGAFQTDAPILATGRVVGPGCRPMIARVGVSISNDSAESPRVSTDVAVVRTAPDGTFTVRADPAKSPFREALAKSRWLNFDVYAIAGNPKPKLVGFWAFSRVMRDGQWGTDEIRGPPPITIQALKGGAPVGCD